MKNKIKYASILLHAICSVAPLLAQPQDSRLNVAILIFDEVQIIDYTGPYEVFGGKCNVFTVAQTKDPITTVFNMRVIPDYDFSNHPTPDILVIPGGGGPKTKNTGKYARLMPVTETPELIEWLTKNTTQAKYVLSVCNGAFTLARIGLLENLSATCTAPFLPKLKEVSPSTTVVYDKKFVDNGKIITSAGLSSGIDAALHIIEKINGRGTAQMKALGMEYNWNPEGTWTRAAMADRYMQFSYSGIPTNSKSLSREGDTNQWENKWSINTSSAVQDILNSVHTTIETGDVYGMGYKTKWTKKKSDQNSSEWSFQDEGSNTWTGYVTVSPSSEKNQLILSVRVKKQGI